MTKRASSKRDLQRAGTEAADAESNAEAATRAERVALLILLALIPLRAVVSETHTFESPHFFRGTAAPPSALPATTYAIIAAIGVAAVLVVCGRLWIGRRGYRWTGAEAGAALLCVAAMVSLGRAGQRHLALIGVLDFLATIALLLTLRQLLVRRWQVRLALGVILATGAMVVAKSAYQVAVEYPDTEAYFRQYDQQRMIAMAGPLGAGRVHDFEQRLRSRAATGYFYHANVLGSFLILIVSVAFAVAFSRFRRRPHGSLILPVVIGVGGAVMLGFSQSKGAALALGCAGLLWIAGHLIRGWLARHRWWSYVLLWAFLLAGGATAVGVQHVRPDALGRSMLFRHFYWQGAWDLVLDQGPWGVGPDNFGRWFLRYKPLVCPEEVQSPHSWIVRAGTEWGVVGLLGLIVLFVGVSRRVARPPPETTETERPSGAIGPWAVAILVVFSGAWLAVLAGADPRFIWLTWMIALPVWVAVFVLGSIESRRAVAFSDDDLGPLAGGLCAGAVGFVLHTGVDLAMFWPGAATTFFAMMAVLLAAREGETPAGAHAIPRRGAAIGVAAIGTAVVSLFLIFVAWPAASAGRSIEAARHSPRMPTWAGFLESPGFSEYRSASRTYPWDGTALAELAGELIRRVPPPRDEPGDGAGQSPTDIVLDVLDELEQRDPLHPALHRYRATVLYQRFKRTGESEALSRAIAAMRGAVAYYPTSPNDHVFLAQLLEENAAVVGSAEVREAAAAEYRTALELDRRRIYVSKPNRYNDAYRAEIESKIDRLGLASRSRE